MCFGIFSSGVQAFSLSNNIVDYYTGTEFTDAGEYTIDSFTVTGNDVKVTHKNTYSRNGSPNVTIELCRLNSLGFNLK